MGKSSLFTDFLTALGVPHTTGYSDKQFQAMTFKSLFGLSHLLNDYGIPSEGYTLADRQVLPTLPAPYLAQTTDGAFVIVTDANENSVTYISEGVAETVPASDFCEASTGVVFFAYPTSQSAEPDYGHHILNIYMARVRDYALVACALLLFGYLFINNGLYRHVSTILLTAFNILGLGFTYLLVQKSMGIKNAVADSVCGVLQAGGCDSILTMKASKFFGIFGWSEVGFAYFSVSLLTLLVFPQWTCYLALCNACCLPFTAWSIWYQKFRAKAWCTLCVSVQATLWLLFFCYLGGGWFKDIFPIRIELFVLGISYVTVLLALNKVSSILIPQKDETD